MTVMAISHLSCHAGNTADCHDEAKWNPEPGWAIRQTHTIEHTANNSGKSVSVVAGGSVFISQHEVENAYARAIDVAAQSGDDQYQAKLNQAYQSYLNMYNFTAASHNTIAARINAQGTGLFGEGAWIDISVEAELVCLGSPNEVDALRDHLIEEAGITLTSAPAITVPSAGENFSWVSVEGSIVIRHEGMAWNEYSPSGQIAFQFVEQRRDDSYIYLLDKSRDLEIALPIGGGQSLIRWSGTGGQWQTWHNMTPS